MNTTDWQCRLGNIRLLGMDVDGVLTDGGVYMFEDGTEFRRFDIKDGLGIKRVMNAGIQITIISSAHTQAVRHRAERLGIQAIYLGIEDKLGVLQQICATYDIDLDSVAFIGDDLADLPVLKAVGFACAPANAVHEVKLSASYVTSASGGHGAVREVCDLLLQCYGG